MPRRLICRTLFLALCVAPTLAVAGWTVGRALPGVVQRRAELLVEPLGAGLECASAQTPRPGVLRLTDVTIRDTELDLPIASCDWLESCWRSGGLVVRAGELRVEQHRLPAFAAMIDRGLRGDDLAAVDMRIETLSVGITGDETTLWRRVHALLPETDAARGPELTLRATGGAELIVTRNRQIEPPTTRLSIATGESKADARVLAPILPGSDALSGATFTGRMSITLGEQPAGELRGEFRGLDLAPLVATRPGALRHEGGALAVVDELRWSAGRITELRASVQAGAGAADEQLLFAANSQLRCPPGQALVADWRAAPDHAIGFDRLAFSIDLDASGIELTGADGCLVSRAGSGLLHAPADGRLPIDAVLRFIAPPDAPVRPTGASVEAFARRLPTPESSDGPAFRTQRP